MAQQRLLLVLFLLFFTEGLPLPLSRRRISGLTEMTSTRHRRRHRTRPRKVVVRNLRNIEVQPASFDTEGEDVDNTETYFVQPTVQKVIQCFITVEPEPLVSNLRLNKVPSNLKLLPGHTVPVNNFNGNNYLGSNYLGTQHHGPHYLGENTFGNNYLDYSPKPVSAIPTLPAPSSYVVTGNPPPPSVVVLPQVQRAPASVAYPPQTYSQPAYLPQPPAPLQTQSAYGQGSSGYAALASPTYSSSQSYSPPQQSIASPQAYSVTQYGFQQPVRQPASQSYAQPYSFQTYG